MTPSPTARSGDVLAGVTVSAAELAAAAAGGNALTVDLLKQLELGRPSGNFVDSAYSLATALAMLQLGARGDTEAQIAAVLHSSGATSAQQAATWKQLDAALRAAAQGDGITLDVANALWLQQGLPVDASFLETLAKNFAAPSTPVDFHGNPQGAADLVNHWVSEATHGMIPTVVSADDVRPLLFLLADAIYFDAHWALPFPATSTADGPFFRPDGSRVSTPMMHGHLWTLPVYSGGGVTAVELPYVGGHFAADVIMPASQPIAAFVAALSPESLAAIEGKLVSTPYVDLTLPKFEISSQLSLQTVLSALGMPDAFDSAHADFSGIDGRTDLYIGLAQQRTRMQVDEAGTTAAAATVIGGLGGGPGPVPVEVVIDHPFLFVVRDRASGAIVFTAQVTDPSAR